MQQQDNHEYPFLYQRQTCHQVQPNQATYQKRQKCLNIYNNYFKAPWMPDRTEANPNELNQDDARYGFRCCHLKNIWTAPLPPETELSRQMTTSTTSIDIMGLQAAYANLHTDQERDYFMQRYHDVISSF